MELITEMEKDIERCENHVDRDGSGKLFEELVAKYTPIFSNFNENLQHYGKAVPLGQEADYRKELNNLAAKLRGLCFLEMKNKTVEIAPSFLEDEFEQIIIDIKYCYKGLLDEIHAYYVGGNITNWFEQLKEGLEKRNFHLVNKSITDICSWYSDQIVNIQSDDYCFNKKELQDNFAVITGFKKRLESIKPIGDKDDKNIRKRYGAMKNNKIFIVHGHDDYLLVETENLMRKLNLDPIILKNKPNGGLSSIIEKFEKHSDVGFAIVLFTPDDVGSEKDDTSNLQTRARQNVVFELGYFAGKLGRNNVVIINNGVEELPSDISGILYTPNQTDWKYKIASELRTAGFDADSNKV